MTKNQNLLLLQLERRRGHFVYSFFELQQQQIQIKEILYFAFCFYTLSDTTKQIYNTRIVIKIIPGHYWSHIITGKSTL